MPGQASTKYNYRTFEAQARLIRALVAAHPEIKLNYKEISLCYGSDMTEYALMHRFRVIKAQAEIIKLGVAQGLDSALLPVEPKDNPKTIEKVDKSNIAKYYGPMTGDAIQFQFRNVRKDGAAIKAHVDNGGDPADVPLNLGATNNDDSVAATPSTVRTTSRRATATSRSRRRLDAADLGEGDIDQTPTKRQKTTTGRVTKARSSCAPRPAAQKAANSMTKRANLPIILDSDDDDDSDTANLAIKNEPVDDFSATPAALHTSPSDDSAPYSPNFTTSGMFSTSGHSFSLSADFTGNPVRSSESLFGVPSGNGFSSFGGGLGSYVPSTGGLSNTLLGNSSLGNMGLGNNVLGNSGLANEFAMFTGGLAGSMNNDPVSSASPPASNFDYADGEF